MPGEGLEPSLPLGKGILSPLRLPISPSGRHRTVTRMAAIAALLCFMACAKRGEVGPTPGELAIRAAERAWAARGRDGFGPVEEALERAMLAGADPVEVYWRQARLRVAQGLAEEQERGAIRYFAGARDAGVRCLDTSLRFRERRLEFGWGDAAPLVEPRRSRCVGWAVLGWARWMDRVGPAAAAVDLDAIDALVKRGWELYADGYELDELEWAAGIMAIIRVDGGADRATGRALLDKRLRQAVSDDEAMIVQLDLMLLAGQPLSIVLTEPRTPEGRQIWAQIRQASGLEERLTDP